MAHVAYLSGGLISMSSRLFASAVAFGPLTLVHDEGELLPDEWLVEANSTLQTVKEGNPAGQASGRRGPWHPVAPWLFPARAGRLGRGLLGSAGVRTSVSRTRTRGHH